MHALQLPLDASVSIRTAPSALGHLGVAARGDLIIGIVFGNKTAAASAARLRKYSASAPAAGAASEDLDAADELAGDVLDRLARYADGEPIDLSDVPISLEHLSTFQRHVVKACRAIPRGERRTYGELAKAAGSPGAARAVGSVMANNRTPLVVPCHRVVGAGGSLGGFSAPDGLAMKRRLLELENGGLF